MAVFKCKMCGGTLEVAEGQTVVTCDFCGTEQTVPSFDNEKKITLFKRANALRAKCEFDKAAGIYESIISEFFKEAEAYWGLVLCRYGIEYVDDPKTGEKIPTCHRTQFSSIFDDTDYKNTIKNADVVAREIYQKEANQIATLQKAILEISSKEEPFDIFICYKENENNQRTHDSVLAQEIYDNLTEKGYRVFFSRITLEDKLGSAYEPYIFAALHSSKIMIHVTTSSDHSDSVWVKNEWSRYLSLISEGQKKTLIPAYKDMDAYDLPEEMQHLQAQNMEKIGSMQDLLRGIDKILSKKTGPIKIQKESVSSNLEYDSLIRKGFTYLKNKKFEQANHCFDLALDAAELCGDAYLGKVLCEYEFTSIEELIDTGDEVVVDSENYVLAKEFASNECKKTLKDIENKLRFNRLDKNYQQAKNLLESKEYDDLDNARSIFEELEDFKDSKDMVFEAKYRIAGLVFENDRILDNIYLFEKAINDFKEIINYSQSKDKIEQLKQIIDEINFKYDETCLSKIEYKLPNEATLNSLTEAAAKYVENEQIFKQFNPIHERVKQEYKTIQEGISAYVFNKAVDVCNDLTKALGCLNLRKCISVFENVYDISPVLNAIECKENEIREIENQKAKKKRIKGFKITGIIAAGLAICIAAGIGINAIIVENHNSTVYKNAISSMENGDYEEAIRYYSENPNYKDSKSKIDVCKALIDLKNTISTGSQQDAVNGIKKIVQAGEKVTLGYDDFSGKILKRALLKSNFDTFSSQYEEVIDSVDFVLYSPKENPGYTFSHWSSHDLSYSNNMTYLVLNSNWSTNVYRITYNLDGGTNSNNNPKNYTIESPDIVLENASKTNYTFEGWFDSNNNKIIKIPKGTYGDINLSAKFEINHYKVTFVDWDGTELYKTTVVHGDNVEYPYANPTRSKTQQYSYTFSGWSESLSNITSDLTIVAQYESTINKYTVTFKDYDGTNLGTSIVNYGTAASLGFTPTRAKTDDYSYYFDSWDKDISCVTEDIVTKAVYQTVKRHHIYFKDYDGTLLWDTRVDHGTTALYEGGTIPSRPSTTQYSYKWIGWNEDLTNITEDEKIFTPKFEPVLNKYIVTFKNYNGAILQTSQVEYGKKAEYISENPTRARTQQYTYAWTGWDKDPNSTTIVGDTVFTATYSSVINKYTVTFRNYNDAVLGTSTVDYGSTASYSGTTPTKPTDYLKYTFSGKWLSSNGGTSVDDLSNVTKDRTVYPQYLTEGYSEIISSSCSSSFIGRNKTGKYDVWGLNSYSCLSQTGESAIPTPYSLDFDKGPIKQIAIGEGFIIVLTEDGTAYSRGRNNNGQLGIGTTVETNVFTEIKNHKFSYIVANGQYSAGLDLDGKLYLWGWCPSYFGYNAYAQTTPKSKVMNTVGMASPGFNASGKFVALGAGFVMFASSYTSIWSFGRNYFGQLGHGNYSGSSEDEHQVYDIDDIAFGGKTYGWTIKKIAAGGDHCLALMEDGSAYAWGLCQYGQCITRGDYVSVGQSTYYIKKEPYRFDTNTNFDGDIVDIAAGTHFSVALTENGSVYAWGENTSGILGVDYSQLKDSSTPRKISYPEKIVKIYAGSGNIFALGESGILYSHGENSAGECGIGTTVSRVYVPNKTLFFD